MKTKKKVENKSYKRPNRFRNRIDQEEGIETDQKVEDNEDSGIEELLVKLVNKCNKMMKGKIINKRLNNIIRLIKEMQEEAKEEEETTTKNEEEDIDEEVGEKAKEDIENEGMTHDINVVKEKNDREIEGMMQDINKEKDEEMMQEINREKNEESELESMKRRRLE